MLTETTPRVRIPNPCHENWDQMSPREKGRFCQACQKEVRDFTGMTDEELFAHLSKPIPEGSCGRFRDDQIIWDDKPVRKLKPWSYYLRYAAVSILTLFSARQAMAQEDEKAVTLMDDQKIPMAVKNVHNDSIVYLFQGQVTDSKTGDALRFATITVERESAEKIQVGYTDEEGNYRIEVPEMNTGEAFKLVVTRRRYKDLVLYEYRPGVKPENLKMKPSYSSSRRRRGRHRHSSGFYVAGSF